MVRQKDRIYMPMGTGGLLRFAEEEKVIFKVTPKQLIILTTIIVAIEIVFAKILPLA